MFQGKIQHVFVSENIFEVNIVTHPYVCCRGVEK